LQPNGVWPGYPADTTPRPPPRVRAREVTSTRSVPRTSEAALPMPLWRELR